MCTKNCRQGRDCSCCAKYQLPPEQLYGLEKLFLKYPNASTAVVVVLLLAAYVFSEYIDPSFLLGE